MTQYTQYNEQIAAATRQLADTAAQVNQLALQNAEKVFALQMGILEENTNAAFAFLGELAQVRDADGYKSLWPKGVQVARENVERSINAGQEAFASSLKWAVRRLTAAVSWAGWDWSIWHMGGETFSRW